MKHKVLVKCTLLVEIEMEDRYMENIQYLIEEHSCPGTGDVGNAIDRAMEEGGARGVCWACGLKGQNEIVSIDGKEYARQ